MWFRSHLAWFLIRFVAIFTLLTAPWPGWDALYSRWLGAVGNTAFLLAPQRWSVRFTPAAQTTSRPLDLQVTIGDRGQMGADGRTTGVVAKLDARGIGWIPTAMFISLVLATPIPQRRRLTALSIGLIVLHGYLALVLGIDVVNTAARAPQMTLLLLPPPGRRILEGLDDTLVVQMGPGFAVAAVVWIATVFRREDGSLVLENRAAVRRRQRGKSQTRNRRETAAPF